MPVKDKVVFIVGPTSIGKTHLAVKLAKAIRGEVISCDSMQVYKRMPVLSQAPSAVQANGTPYRLIKFLSPSKEFSAAIFRKKAVFLIDDILNRGKVPIIAGGTGLYVKALIDGLFPSPKADMNFRKKMYNYASRMGSAKLHDKLKKIDAQSACLIHPNDTRRIVRALELWHSTGRTMTELKTQTSGIADKYDIKIFGITAPREKIYSNVNNRVEKMFREGLVSEVKRLSKVKLSKTAKAVLGFKEILGFLKDEYDVETAQELMKQNTRRFAKRQLTWFRADKRIRWLDVTRMGEREIIKKIASALRASQ